MISLMIHSVLLLIVSTSYITRTEQFKEAIIAEVLQLKEPPPPQVRKPIIRSVIYPTGVTNGWVDQAAQSPKAVESKPTMKVVTEQVALADAEANLAPVKNSMQMEEEPQFFYDLFGAELMPSHGTNSWHEDFQEAFLARDQDSINYSLQSNPPIKPDGGVRNGLADAEANLAPVKNSMQMEEEPQFFYDLFGAELMPSNGHIYAYAPQSNPPIKPDKGRRQGFADQGELILGWTGQLDSERFDSLQSGSVQPKPLNPPNDEAYHDMYFKGTGTNPFIDTEDDHLSTFGMDVDTGSYTITRRYLTDGYLPPPEAVRVEEFVNTFDYNYIPPTESAFAIHIDGAPSKFGEGKRLQLLRIGLQGRVIPSEHRKDAILTFVIDVSGSMEQENRLGLVKKALTLLVDQLRPTDKVGIVVYGSHGRLVLPHTGIEQRSEILSAINALRPGGSTNAEEGLRIGYDLAWRNASVNHINRVILCSDGVANVGNTGPRCNP